jgi:hypothetical protein
MIEWKDNTTYSQSDTERVPTNWITHVDGNSIIVFKRIDSTGWFFKSSFGIERKIGVMSHDDAKIKSLEIIQHVLRLEIKKNQEFLAALESAKGE